MDGRDDGRTDDMWQPGFQPPLAAARASGAGERRQPDGAGAVRGQAHDRRPGRAARAARRGPARPRPHPRRGGARAGQDARREVGGRRHRRAVPPRPVHARPRAGRPRRHPHVPPAAGRVPGLARPGVHQPAAGRRDQPGAGEGAERAARGDAGAAGHDRARDPPRAPAVPRDGDAEPDRVRGHLSAARGPGRPLHDEGPRRLPQPDRGVRDRRPGDHAAAGDAAGDRSRPTHRDAAAGRRGVRRPGAHRVRRAPRRARPATPTSSGSASSPATSASAPAREPRSAWSSPPGRWRSSAAATTPCRPTSPTSPSTSCATAWCCRTRRCPTRSPPTSSCAGCMAALPVPDVALRAR